MRRTLVLALAVLVGSTVSPAFGATHPALRLARRAPLEVQGTGFRPHERVTVAAGNVSLSVRSSSTGRFLAQFPFADRCSAERVVATGRSGGRAVLYLPPALCPVAQSQQPT